MPKDDNKKQQVLQQQETEDRQRYLALAEKAEQPDPLQQRLEGEDTDFLDWEEGAGKYAGKPIDVTQAPGLGPTLSLYQKAAAGQQGERMGQGLITMGSNAADPGLAANLKEESQLKREQAAAGGLEEAVAQKDAEVRGSALPLVNLSQSRALSLADMAAGQSRFSTGLYTQFRPQPGFFGRIGNSFADNFGGSLGKGLASGGLDYFFRDGGDTGPYLGDYVVAGEDGPELAVDRTGRRRWLGGGGPERFRVERPETIIPAPESRALALADAASGEKPLPDWVGRFKDVAATASALLNAPQPGRSQSGPYVPPSDTPEPPPASRLYSDAPQSSAPAVRPRRGLPPVAQEILARAKGVDQPVSDEPSPYQPAAPSDLPTRPAPYYGVVGGDVDPRTAPPDVRPRVARPQEFLEKRMYDDLTAPTPRDGNGRGRSILKGLARGFLRGGAAGAILGAGAEAVDPSIDERQDLARQTAGDRGRLNEMYAVRGQAADVVGKEDMNRYRGAVTDYTLLRPGIEEDKMRERAAKDEQARVFRALSSFRGQRLDPNNPRVAKLLADADAAGIPVDVEAFNESKGNVVRYARTDPAHPERTQTVERNVVTGEETVLGQKGFQPTRDGQGQTTSERKAAEDRETAHADLQKQRTISNKFRSMGLAQGDRRISLSQASQDYRFSQDERKELAAANKLAAKSEEYARSAQDLSGKTTFKDPETGEIKESKKWAAKRDEYLSKAAALRREFADTYGYLFAPSEGEAPRMTPNQFKGLFPNAAGSPATEASRLGITLSDTDQGVRGPSSPMPRRGAPVRARAGGAPVAAPSPGKTHVTRSDARRLYPELRNKSDAEVDAAIRAGGYEPMP